MLATSVGMNVGRIALIITLLKSIGFNIIFVCQLCHILSSTKRKCLICDTIVLIKLISTQSTCTSVNGSSYVNPTWV